MTRVLHCTTGGECSNRIVEGCAKRARCSISVSYTHLDVYKRQVDTEAKTYAILPAPDKATDYGDYPASEGETDRFVTFRCV